MTSELPGVTLWLMEATFKPLTHPASSNKGRGLLRLDVDVDDLTTWEAVLEKLDGMRIHAGSNIAEAMVSALRHKFEDARQLLEKKLREQEVELQHLRHENSQLKQEQERLESATASGATYLEALRLLGG